MLNKTFDVPPRRADWPERLIAVAAKHNGAFAWGTRDCATMFSDAVVAVTGQDPLAALRPWRTEQEALRRLAQSGFASVERFVEAHFPEIVPVDARRGDLVFTDAGTKLSCPSVIIGSLAMSLDDTGVLLFPRTMAKRAFMVGR